ncbi:MAG: protein-glutamate O-methyltransferase CheR [Nitrospiraceae bacterium]|nr:protein-glutamate O-methyltransferase CheR [Nitrospiraceae bacterium]
MLTGTAHSYSNLSLSDEMFFLFSDLIYRAAGIKLNVQKKSLLISRLMKRLKKHNMDSFTEYYKKVKADEEELVEMLNCISTNTTKFFREKHHFEYLKNKVMPELLKNKADERIIRIWSAGCSTGEEPYSITIAVCEALKEFGVKSSELWDIKILATDISTKVLRTADAGIYEYEQLPEEIPKEIISRYFLKGNKENEGLIKVKDFIRDKIRFRRLNLKDGEYPLKRSFDVIFCRNVMIYFDDGMKRHVVSKFHQHLSDRGHLFLGHSETVFDREQLVPTYITVYKKSMNGNCGHKRESEDRDRLETK